MPLAVIKHVQCLNRPFSSTGSACLRYMLALQPPTASTALMTLRRLIICVEIFFCYLERCTNSVDRCAFAIVLSSHDLMPPRCLSVLLVTRGSAVAADITVLILTWIKTYQHWRELRRLKMSTSVSTLLLRDGKLCYPSVI